MKRARLFSAVAVLLIAIFIANIFAINNVGNASAQESQPFHVGVTYGGSNITEAQQLIDRVKNYTNLFVVQSGSLMSNLTGMEQICDYAVNAGLNIIVSFGYYGATPKTCNDFLAIAPARWGSHFLGLYYNDEPGGKMLDGSVALYDNATGNSIIKSMNYIQVQQSGQSNDSSYSNTYFFHSSGEIDLHMSTSFSKLPPNLNPTPTSSSTSQNSRAYVFTTSNSTRYFTNGTLSFSTESSSAEEMISNRQLWYQPNGEVQDEKGTLVTDAGNTSQFEPYQQVWDSRPLQTYTETANIYVSTQQNILNSIDNQTNVNLFTSDYGLYWFDYLGGYNTVFAELGWNNTVAQEIGLVRGAANLQGKDWGTIIDWKYNQPPYLPSGDEMYDQMLTSYECGAKYVVVFNYADGMDGPYGTLQDEHFQALQHFWNDVVQNPNVKHGGITAEATLVLPKDYGWGMRHENDTIWGLWKADDTSQQIWNQVQSRLAQYGSKLDIVYDDPAYNVTGKYSQIYYWNQSAAPFATPLIIGLLVAAAIIGAVTIIVIRAKRRQQSSVITRT
jgi:hypothetical protein